MDFKWFVYGQRIVRFSMFNPLRGKFILVYMTPVWNFNICFHLDKFLLYTSLDWKGTCGNSIIHNWKNIFPNDDYTCCDNNNCTVATDVYWIIQTCTNNLKFNFWKLFVHHCIWEDVVAEIVKNWQPKLTFIYSTKFVVPNILSSNRKETHSEP